MNKRNRLEFEENNSTSSSLSSNHQESSQNEHNDSSANNSSSSSSLISSQETSAEYEHNNNDYTNSNSSTSLASSQNISNDGELAHSSISSQPVTDRNTASNEFFPLRRSYAINPYLRDEFLTDDEDYRLSTTQPNRFLVPRSQAILNNFNNIEQNQENDSPLSARTTWTQETDNHGRRNNNSTNNEHNVMASLSPQSIISDRTYIPEENLIPINLQTNNNIINPNRFDANTFATPSTTLSLPAEEREELEEQVDNYHVEENESIQDSPYAMVNIASTIANTDSNASHARESSLTTNDNIHIHQNTNSLSNSNSGDNFIPAFGLHLSSRTRNNRERNSNRARIDYKSPSISPNTRINNENINPNMDKIRRRLFD